MSTSKAALVESLLFRPGHGGDPVPWLLDHLSKEQLFQVAQIQLELQKSILAANNKAIEQLVSVVKGAGR